MTFIKKHKYQFILVLIIIIAGLIYGKCMYYGFVNWDDDENIRGNKYTELKSENLQYHYTHSRYKALAILSFTFDNYLFGSKPGYYHAHNILLHLINTILVFLLTLRLSKRGTVALITASLFALHPAFVEAVTWITARKDLLFVLFSVLTILAYLKFLSHKKLPWLLLTTALIYLASLAKIQAFTLPLILLGLDWFYSRKFSFALIVEKIAVFAFVADIWLLVIPLSVLYFLISFQEKYDFLKSGKVLTFMYWAFLLTFCTSVFVFPFGSLGIHSPHLQSVIIVAACTGIILLFFIKRKSILAKLPKLNPSVLLIISLVPLIIILIEWFKIWSHLDYFKLNFWGHQSGVSIFYSFGERLMLAVSALSVYFLRFFQAFPQNPMIAYPQKPELSLSSANMLLTLIIMVVLLAGLIFIAFKYYKINRLVIFGLIWFFASICIVLHIIPIEGRVLASDRYTYPSYIGFFIIFASFADYLLKKYRNWIIWFSFSLILVFLGVKTFLDIGIWKNSKTLWQAAIKANPKNDYAMYSLSLAYFVEDKNAKQSIKYIDEAITLKDDYQYYNNRGRIKFSQGNLTSALEDFNKAVFLDSTSSAAYNNRGAVYQQLCMFRLAFADYSKALKINPDYQDAQINKKKTIHLIEMDSILFSDAFIPASQSGEITGFIKTTAQILINLKQFDRATSYLQKGILISPANSEFYEMLAVMHQLNKNYDQALSAYNRGLTILPDNGNLLTGRGILYLEKGDTISACEDWQKAISNGYTDATVMKNQFCK